NNSFSPETDKNKLNIYAAVEQNFGRPLSPIEMEMIKQWQTEDSYPDDLIQLALKEAVLNQAFSLKYMDRILLSWERKGIKTKNQAIKNI
ncbi:DnaD domain-containing protein, partial [Enterococcus faecium]